VCVCVCVCVCSHLWVLQGLHGAVVGWTQRGEADHHVHIGVLLHGVTHVLIHRDEDLFMAPVVLLLVVSTEKRRSWRKHICRAAFTSVIFTILKWKRVYFCLYNSAHLRERVDHGRDRRLLSGADVIKVDHALHGPRLHTPHDGLGVFAEEGSGLGCRERNAVTQRNLNTPNGGLFLSLDPSHLHYIEEEKTSVL